jgi:hypothetical protein
MSQAVATLASRASSGAVESNGTGVRMSSYDRIFALAETLGAENDAPEVFATGQKIDSDVRANREGVKKRVLARRDANQEKDLARKMEKERQVYEIQLERARRSSAIDKTMLAEEMANQNAELESLAGEGMAKSAGREASKREFLKAEAAANLAKQALDLAKRQFAEKVTENEKREAATRVERAEAENERVNKILRDSAVRAGISLVALNKRKAELEEGMKAAAESATALAKLEKQVAAAARF